MFLGRFSRVRLIAPLANAKPAFFVTPKSALLQTRLSSSRPGLFTLDLDSNQQKDAKQSDTEKQIQIEESANISVSTVAEEAIRIDETPAVSANAGNFTDPISETEKSNGPARNDPDGLDDIFADIVFDTETTSQNSSDEIDSFFGDLLASNQMENSRDELGGIADLHVNGTKAVTNEGKSGKSRNVLTDEKELFDKIFATYSQPDVSSSASSDKLQQMVLSNLQESFSSVNTNASLDYGLDPRPQGRPQSYESLSAKESRAIEENTREALKETLAFIEKMETRGEIVAFARETFQRFRTEFPKTSFYLHKLRRESSSAYLARHKTLSDETKLQSEAKPEMPTLNVFTMPTIFNKVVSVLAEKHHDGALALSLFNLAKEDLHLYTVVCNQHTYNEMLKVYWLFYGKRSLCEIELIVVEMMNNGFQGDAKTFVILREILGTYYSMKSGNSNFNPGGASIWSKEDERRARNLTQKLKVLGRKLRKERFSGLAPRRRNDRSES